MGKQHFIAGVIIGVGSTAVFFLALTHVEVLDRIQVGDNDYGPVIVPKEIAQHINQHYGGNEYRLCLLGQNDTVTGYYEVSQNMFAKSITILEYCNKPGTIADLHTHPGMACEPSLADYAFMYNHAKNVDYLGIWCGNSTGYFYPNDNSYYDTKVKMVIV